jgi:hypothetical protein
VTTSSERLQQLRARAQAADVERINDPEELARRGIRAHLAEVNGFVPPDQPEIAVRLHGPGVPDHQIPVREAAGILASIQEAVSSIGQAILRETTTRGAIQAKILRATELSLSPVLSSGSVVFHLTAQAEQVSGGEAAELTGTDTLVDSAMAELFSVFEQSEALQLDSAALAHALRKLGARTAKHLSDLVKQVTADEIDIDLAWRNPRGRRREASLQRQAALALGRAIELNRVEVKVVELIGVLVTVSTEGRAELRTDSGERIKLSVDPPAAPGLRPFYTERVVARAEQTTVWSTNTGKETRTFSLVDLSLVDEEPASHEPSIGQLSTNANSGKHRLSCPWFRGRSLRPTRSVCYVHPVPLSPRSGHWETSA